MHVVFLPHGYDFFLLYCCFMIFLTWMLTLPPPPPPPCLSRVNTFWHKLLAVFLTKENIESKPFSLTKLPALFQCTDLYFYFLSPFPSPHFLFFNLHLLPSHPIPTSCSSSLSFFLSLPPLPPLSPSSPYKPLIIPSSTSTVHVLGL